MACVNFFRMMLPSRGFLPCGQPPVSLGRAGLQQRSTVVSILHGGGKALHAAARCALLLLLQNCEKLPFSSLLSATQTIMKEIAFVGGGM